MNFAAVTVADSLGFQAETNLFSIAAKGGFLMIVLLIISIMAITIIIERLMKLKKSKRNEEDFLMEIYGYLSENQIDKAIQVCEQRESSPISKILSKVIENSGKNISETKEMIEIAIKKEIYHFEKNLGTLASFAAIAPLIGFLGTVTGMVKVFMKIAETGGGVDITLLASGIWEALITTVGGLTVGIISILFYNYIVGKVEELANELEENAHDFLLTYRRIRDEH